MPANGSDARARLAAEGLDAGEWSNGPHDRYGAHEHGYDKVIVVAAGGIAFFIDGDSEALSLGAGDRLELPAGTTHAALVSAMGVTCLEAHLPAGALPSGAPRRRPAGDW